MPASKLTEYRLKNLKPKAAPYKESDGLGLYVLVQPNGSKLWRYNYRFLGKQKTLAIGAYPDVGLAKAREVRGSARALLDDDVDPAAAKQDAKAPADEPVTFRDVAEEWLLNQSYSPKQHLRVHNRLKNDAYPAFGSIAVGDVEQTTVLRMLKTIERRGAVSMARRVKGYISNIFDYAIPHGYCLANPIEKINRALKPRPAAKHRAKLSARDLPVFWGRFHASAHEELTKLAVRWTLYTMVRTGETRFAARPELEDLAGPDPVWRISGDRMKMRFEHLVPLPRQAVAMIPRILELGRGADFLFPVPGTKSGVISENRMLYMLYDLGYRGTATIHGFRGLASTVLNEQTREVDGMPMPMFAKDWIERQLAHVEENEVRGAYNSAEWIKPRRTMLQWWADWLDAQEAIGLLVG